MTIFDQRYQDLLRQVRDQGTRVFNQRTQHWVRAVPGVHLSIDLETEDFPLLTLREIPPKLFIAEQLWFISGSNRPSEFLQQYTSIWNPFISEDGTLTAAYGYRWRHHFGRDQLREFIELLRRDPSSRQAVVVAWDPARDGLLGEPQKNVPCPFSFMGNILDGRLNLHVCMRANDLVIGAPYDIAGFALLQCILAQELGLKPGVYSHSIAYAEFYEVHAPAVEELLERENTHAEIQLRLPERSFGRAERQDDVLVKEIASSLAQQYHPSPKISGLRVIQ